MSNTINIGKKPKKIIQSKEREWQQAALEHNHLKFCSITMEHVWMDALMWLPAIAWNMIAIMLVNKLFPGGKNPADANANMIAKIVYAVVITIVVSTILYFNYRRKISLTLKTMQAQK